MKSLKCCFEKGFKKPHRFHDPSEISKSVTEARNLQVNDYSLGMLEKAIIG